jgi:hypothetical protein
MDCYCHLHRKEAQAATDSRRTQQQPSTAKKFGSGGGSKKIVPWQDHLPAHIKPSVCGDAMALALDIAKHGLPEGGKHCGFVIIVGDGAELMRCDADQAFVHFGPCEHNPFEKGNLYVSKNSVKRGAFHDGETMLRMIHALTRALTQMPFLCLSRRKGYGC